MLQPKKTMPTIAICDPFSADFNILKDGQMTLLTVSPDFLEILRNDPVEMVDVNVNCFIFGVQRRTRSYNHAGDAASDHGVVAIVEITKDVFPLILSMGEDLRTFIKEKFNTERADWHNPTIMAAVRERFPHILFVGDIAGGDTGVGVYTHIDEKGAIDGIILDDDYYFGESESDSEDEFDE